MFSVSGVGNEPILDLPGLAGRTPGMLRENGMPRRWRRIATARFGDQFDGRRQLAAAIKTHRIRLGISQASLAEQLGVTPQAISKWETRAACPSADKIAALVAILAETSS